MPTNIAEIRYNDMAIRVAKFGLSKKAERAPTPAVSDQTGGVGVFDRAHAEGRLRLP
jgi:hypothetical protein